MMKIRLSLLMVGGALLGGALVVRADSTSELGALHSFEVHQFEAYDFSSERERVLPEVIEYARTAIQSNEQLLYHSPGEGLVRFYCDSPSCNRIRVEVTKGKDGPVVWKTVRQLKPPVALKEPDSRRFARSIIEDLARDYEAALTATPATIPIRE
ncbi:MAG TPA: hypothetical protein V6C99_02540 [Oculatellaceae cyanobacterium]|jgi:hypothetical protein